jgi:hypothetical protein
VRGWEGKIFRSLEFTWLVDDTISSWLYLLKLAMVSLSLRVPFLKTKMLSFMEQGLRPQVPSSGNPALKNIE